MEKQDERIESYPEDWERRSYAEMPNLSSVVGWIQLFAYCIFAAQVSAAVVLVATYWR